MLKKIGFVLFAIGCVTLFGLGFVKSFNYEMASNECTAKKVLEHTNYTVEPSGLLTYKVVRVY